MTAFFGGTSSPNLIVLYFWENQTYFQPPVTLIRPRKLSGCALVRKPGQPAVIAIAGGNYTNSKVGILDSKVKIPPVIRMFYFFFKGMEIFDPSTNTVELIVDELPPEIRTSSNYFGLTMVSVENNTELIILGGETAGKVDSILRPST